MQQLLKRDELTAPGDRGAFPNARRSGDSNNPFLSRAWLRHWIEHRSNGLEAFPIMLDDGETFAPLLRGRIGGVRVLRLMGTGDADFTGIVTNQSSEAAWDRVIAELARRRREWDLLHLHSVAERDAIVPALERHLRRRVATRVYESCPFIRITGTWAEFVGARKELRRELARWDRRLQELGPVEIRKITPPVAPAVLEECVEVERASWKWEHGNSALKPGPRRDFLFALLDDPEGPARLWILRVGSRVAAWAITLESATRWSFYITAYRQDIKNAGSALLGGIVKAAHEAGCTSFSLLGGDHHYKDVWANDNEDVYEVVCGSNALGGMARLAYQTRWRVANSALLKRLRDVVLRSGDRR